MSLTGRLRHRVDVYRSSVSLDSDGNTVEGWAVVYRAIAAEVLTGPGREGVAAATVIGETDMRATLRYFPGLEYADRIVYAGRGYSIVELLTDRTGSREYRLRLKEVQDFVEIASSSS